MRPRIFTYWLCATLVAAFAGPFGTYENQTLPQNLTYWGLVCAVAVVLAWAVRVMFWRLWPRVSVLRSEIATGCLFVVVFTPLLWLFNDIWFTGTSRFQVSFWALFAYVGIISGTIAVIVLAFLGNRDAKSQNPAPPEPANLASPPPPPPLLTRLPEDLRGEIYSVSVEDHRVHVDTDRGRGTLFMRFGDAIAMLGEVDGLRVHRSHWVARGAVTSQRRHNGRMFLVLKCGSEIPVSRNYRPQAEAAFTEIAAAGASPASGSGA